VALYAGVSIFKRAAMKKEKFVSMKSYFDSVSDPYNFTTLSKKRDVSNLEKSVKWYHDSAINYAHELMEPIRGKNILDIGCGVGTHPVWLARNGARVTGIDISDKRITLARKVIERESLNDLVTLLARNAEDTGLPEKSFDVIYGQDVLMFLEGKFNKFINEAKRVLKDDGVLIFSEALENHPIAKMYRKYMAPREWREFTDYFNFKHLEEFQKFFRVDYKTFYLTGFFIYAFKMYMPNHKIFTLTDSFFNKVDSGLIKVFPGLGKYSWRIIFRAKNK